MYINLGVGFENGKSTRACMTYVKIKFYILIFFSSMNNKKVMKRQPKEAPLIFFQEVSMYSSFN